MNRILIANRGEIAVRIVRACHDSGRVAIAAYADADADAEFVRLADEAWALEGSTPAETYLDVAKLIGIARRAGADAVHPGYGFLAENADFARAVLAAGLVWIGPPPEVIDLLGDKVAARRLAQRVGAPLVPGTPGPIGGADEAVAFAAEHGLPIAIKAAHGGGGRGLRVVWRAEDVAEQYDAAVREATQAFGRGECFVERYLDRPRHVEVQILADSHGTVVPVGTRDCSLQRRNQKLVEEAPAPFLTAAQHALITGAARDICAAAGYIGAGTVEFLLAADGTVSFLEVNTRLQVEHPVTEETSRVDLVLEQFRLAEGGRLDPTPPPVHGHAIEFRINAEDPSRGFLPVAGTVTGFRPPSGPGVRLDSGVRRGSVVPGTFDSLLAKLVVWGPTRDAALARARRALDEFEVDGLPTVLPFDRDVAADPAFTGEPFGAHTRWIETDYVTRTEPEPLPEPPTGADVVRTWVELDGRRVRLGIPATILAAGSLAAPALPGGGSAVAAAPALPEGAVVSPITGSLVRWLASDGAVVAEGEAVAVLEAMKMETSVLAPRAGTLAVSAAEGDAVEAGGVLGIVE
ncbi:acetyl/propionyl/methylcrotonyl-CoA carboxylase subunit alpha [Brooklawnia cerclae]|uniref:biotin carboxylase n=1 Tax=Brooklawnia cerclae TaxID=349934 RepID=A0ABX0SFP9_9ACTN|nr:biotin carboxylase N-terminal domain-containing protein [Brooklawnia cerclae]NIH55451.1 acetyl-CoA/propionyl-CoA carboxylase biotin carboxyl carrier protein [Brooklawnia cerclae]